MTLSPATSGLHRVPRMENSEDNPINIFFGDCQNGDKSKIWSLLLLNMEVLRYYCENDLHWCEGIECSTSKDRYHSNLLEDQFNS
jgi:hypothetical protein